MTCYDFMGVTCNRESNQRRACPSQGPTDRNALSIPRAVIQKMKIVHDYGNGICDVNAIITRHVP